jgi:UDP-3-O-acyl N-acetylglucosamine deacetylase
MSEGRRTVRERSSVSGVGLHTGQPCTLTFAPAAPGAGIRFVRTDRPGAAPVPADAGVAELSERRTQLGQGDDAFHTVEHALAAVAGLGIDDVTIEMTGPEPPIDDGSAAAYVAALDAAGIVAHGGRTEALVLDGPVRLTDGVSSYEAHPADALSLEVSIAFPHPLIGEQSVAVSVTPATFRTELAPARTFGFVHEVEALRAKGLIRGGTLDAALVLDDRGLVQGALHWPDEFVRHKALDCVGDLALAGRPVHARVIAHRPSHRGTVRLVRELVTHARRQET